MTAPSRESPRTVRIVGTLLAIVWLCAGIAALLGGSTTRRWILMPLGLAAIWYAVIWILVAAKGRRLTLREALTPWRSS